jgi:hypothetical protein
MVVLLVFEASSGELVHVHHTGGGRAGEPMDLYWSPDDQRIWMAYVSGCMPIQSVQLFAEEPRPIPWLDGRLPRGCASGRGVNSSARFVTGVDTNTGARLWYRPLGSRGAELLHCSAGYFDGHLDDMDGMTVRMAQWPYDPRPLAEVVDRVLDPKRVRASSAGVEIVPVNL